MVSWLSVMFTSPQIQHISARQCTVCVRVVSFSRCLIIFLTLYGAAPEPLLRARACKARNLFAEKGVSGAAKEMFSFSGSKIAVKTSHFTGWGGCSLIYDTEYTLAKKAKNQVTRMSGGVKSVANEGWEHILHKSTLLTIAKIIAFRSIWLLIVFMIHNI